MDRGSSEDPRGPRTTPVCTKQYASICVCAPLQRLCRTLTDLARWARGAILNKRTGQAMCEFGALTVQVVCLGMDGGSKQMRTGSGSALEPPTEEDFPSLCPWKSEGVVRISGFGSRMLTRGNRRRGSGLWPRVSLPDCGIFRFACIFDRPRAPPPSRLAARHRYL